MDGGRGSRPGPRRPVVIPAQPRWPAAADAVIEELRQATALPRRRFQHIGSTAVPGMPAKNVIDIQVQVPDLDVLQVSGGPRLLEIGYVHLPDITADAVPVWTMPAGDPGPVTAATPVAGWQKRLWIRRRHGPEVNLHIRRIDAPNARLALLFRDWLRAHPQEARAYGEFKRRLAAATPDVEQYSDIKDPVVHMIAATAARWARQTGWQPSDR